MIAAPAVTYNGVYNTSTRMSFFGKDHLPLGFRFPIGKLQLVFDGTTLDYISTNMVMDNVLGLGVGGTYWVNGVNNAYAPDQMDDMFSLFNEIEWKSLCFEYIPRVQGGTSTGIQLTWAFSGDPEYARTHNFATQSIGGNTVYCPTEGSIRPMRGSNQFSAWVPKACLDVTEHINQKEQYYTSTWNNVPGTYISTAAATLRQCCPGCMYISGSDNVAPAGTGTSVSVITVMCGTLFMEGSVVLKEFSPPQLLPASTLQVSPSSSSTSTTTEVLRGCKRLHPEEQRRLLDEQTAKAVRSEEKSRVRSVTPKR